MSSLRTSLCILAVFGLALVNSQIWRCEYSGFSLSSLNISATDKQTLGLHQDTPLCGRAFLTPGKSLQGAINHCKSLGPESHLATIQNVMAFRNQEFYSDDTFTRGSRTNVKASYRINMRSTSPTGKWFGEDGEIVSQAVMDLALGYVPTKNMPDPDMKYRSMTFQPYPPTTASVQGPRFLTKVKTSYAYPYLCVAYAKLEANQPASPNDWTYTGLMGVEYWGYRFNSKCNAIGTGSPINIDKFLAKNVTVGDLELVGHDRNVAAYSNLTSHGVVYFSPDFEQFPPSVTRGAVNFREYYFHSLHVHKGSEHTIDNVRFDLEIHSLYYNWDYNSMEEAAGKRNGMVILVHLGNVISGQACNSGLNDIFGSNPYTGSVAADDDIKIYKRSVDEGKKTHTRAKRNTNRGRMLNLNALNTNINTLDYYTYVGSTTTPECYGHVRYIIFKDIVNICPSTMDSINAVRYPDANGAATEIKPNFRPVQPLGDRIIGSAWA